MTWRDKLRTGCGPWPTPTGTSALSVGVHKDVSPKAKRRGSALRRPRGRTALPCWLRGLTQLPLLLFTRCPVCNPAPRSEPSTRSGERGKELREVPRAAAQLESPSDLAARSCTIPDTHSRKKPAGDESSPAPSVLSVAGGSAPKGNARASVPCGPEARHLGRTRRVLCSKIAWPSVLSAAAGATHPSGLWRF